MASSHVRTSIQELKKLTTLLKQLEELETQARDENSSLNTLQGALQSVEEDIQGYLEQLTKHRAEIIALEERIAEVQNDHERALVKKMNIRNKVEARQEDASIFLMEQIRAKKLQADHQYKKWSEVDSISQDSAVEISDEAERLNSPGRSLSTANSSKSAFDAVVVPMKRRHSSSASSTAGPSLTRFAPDVEDQEDAIECTTTSQQMDSNGSTTPPLVTVNRDPSPVQPRAALPQRTGASLTPTCTRCYRGQLNCSGPVLNNLSCDSCRSGSAPCSFTYSRKPNPSGKVNPLALDELGSLIEDYPLLEVREIYERRMFGEVSMVGLRQRLRRLGINKRSRRSTGQRDAAGGSV